MNAVKVKVSESFKKSAKPLLKKYPSLFYELSQLEKNLINNPKLGIPIGQDCYKIRLAVKSKGKGKSGGVRVISHVDTEIIGKIENKDNAIIITLISIYNKSEIESISNKEINLLLLIEKIKQNE